MYTICKGREIKMKNKCLLFALAVFALGVAAGAAAAAGTDPAAFSEYFGALEQNAAAVGAGVAAANAAVVWAVLFFSAFFKFGAVTASLAGCMRGFVDGYAVTAILRTLGMRGIGMCFADCIGAPLAVLMCALCIEKLASGEMCGRLYLAKSVLLLSGLVLAAALGGGAAALLCRGAA